MPSQTETRIVSPTEEESFQVQVSDIFKNESSFLSPAIWKEPLKDPSLHDRSFHVSWTAFATAKNTVEAMTAKHHGAEPSAPFFNSLYYLLSASTPSQPPLFKSSNIQQESTFPDGRDTSLCFTLLHTCLALYKYSVDERRNECPKHKG